MDKMKKTFIALLVITNTFLYAGTDMQNLNKDYYLYVGTYTDGNESEGIYLYKLNWVKGELTFINSFEANNPSFLATDYNEEFLFACNEINNFNEEKHGSVTSYRINKSNKSLTELNVVSSGGANPCYVSVDNKGKYVFTANYTGGNIGVIPINDDGSLDSLSYVAQHEGKGGNPERQSAPHAHSVKTNMKNNIVYAVDLGIDKVMIYNFDETRGKLNPAETLFVKLASGAGPRQIVEYPYGNFAYVINELNSTVTLLNKNIDNGSLHVVESYSTLPDNFSGDNFPADIRIHPNGKFLYASNRGHNSIVIYSINETDGKLKILGHQSTKGNWPRNFTIDPSGKFLLVANQHSNNVFVFEINIETGMLKDTGYSIDIPAPVCLLFLNN
jgi:6-phosphogluconolactonase